MTNHFKVLNLPELPWLDAARLRKAFQTASLSLHPDKGGAVQDFQNLSTASRVLADHPQRLKHFLDLKGFPVKASPPPADLIALNFRIASLFAAAKGPTERDDELRRATDEICDHRNRLLAELKALNDEWIATEEEGDLLIQLESIRVGLVYIDKLVQSSQLAESRNQA